MISLFITHLFVGALGYVIGSVKMKRDIEVELFKVLDEFQKKTKK